MLNMLARGFCCMGDILCLGAPNLSLGIGGKPPALTSGGGRTGAGGLIGTDGGLDKSCLTFKNNYLTVKNCDFKQLKHPILQ